MQLDTLIRNGTVIDGTGGLRYQADVGLAGGRVVAVGRLDDPQAARVVDAAGLVVCPGFIDMHSHSDVTLLDDPGGESKVFQGVTTEVTGNCGFSPFPIGPSGPEGAGDPDMASSHPWDWRDLDGWADALESSGISINVAPQVGHSSIRSAVGLRDNRRPTADELEAMRRLVAESIEQGAFSFSTGLTVAPSMYGDTEEVVALAEAMSPFEGAFYVTHARLWAGNHVKAVEEAIEIGRRAGVPVQYSHMAIIDPRYFGTGDEMVRSIEQAHEEGLDATYDVYPYTAAGSHLAQMVPMWLQDGGESAMLRRLRDPETRRRALDDLRQGFFGGLPWKFDTFVISYVKNGGQQRRGRQVRGADRRGAGAGRPRDLPRPDRGGGQPRRSGRPQQGGERCPVLPDASPSHDRLGRQRDLAKRGTRWREAAPALLRHVPAHLRTVCARAVPDVAGDGGP